MDYLSNVKIENVIPAFSSVEEGALYIIENNEKCFNNIIMSIGLKELAFTEATNDVVVTEASVKEIKDGIVTILENFWAGLKDAFEKVLNFISGKVKEFKEKMAVKEFNKLQEKAAKIKEKDKEGKVKVYTKTFEYKNYDALISMEGPVWNALEKYQKNVHDTLFDFKSAAGDNTNAFALKDLYEKVNDANDELVKAFVSTTGAEISNENSIIEVIKNYIKGEEVDVTKEYIVNNLKEIFDYCVDYNKSASEVKKLLNKSKKSYNNDIALIKKEKKDVPAGVYRAYATAIKKAKNVHTGIVGAILSCTSQRLSCNMKILMKLAMATTVKESTEDINVDNEPVVESSSYQSELVSLFNFGN